MRAGRLVELLLRLQVRGPASAADLAGELDVSVRTVYRDVSALSAAGVPVYTEVGRHGGIRLDPSYRVAGLPRLDTTQARSVLFAVVPAIADQLGLDPSAADQMLLPAMERPAETAARAVRDRLLVEPTHWFARPDATPALADVARAVWTSRELRISYRGSDLLVQPLGLVLKGDAWYLLGQAGVDAGRPFRLFRLSRIDSVELLDHRFDRPADFDLAAEWARCRQAFLDSITPEYAVTVRVAPTAEPLLATLDEARPDLPLPAGITRDQHGWARLQLRFDHLDRAARHLLRLGAEVEVLAPAELRERMARTAADIAALYDHHT